MTEYAHYEAGAHKLLSDNRRLYFVQSQLTTREKRAEFSEAEAYAREQGPPSDEEMREAFTLKYL